MRQEKEITQQVQWTNFENGGYRQTYNGYFKQVQGQQPHKLVSDICLVDACSAFKH